MKLLLTLKAVWLIVAASQHLTLFTRISPLLFYLLSCEPLSSYLNYACPSASLLLAVHQRLVSGLVFLLLYILMFLNRI